RKKDQPWVTYYSIVALGGIGPDAAPAGSGLFAILDQAQTPRKKSWVQGGQVSFRLGKNAGAGAGPGPRGARVRALHGPPQPSGSDTQAHVPPYEAAINALGKIGDDSEQVLSRLLRIADTGAVATVQTAEEVESENQRRIAQSARIRLRLAALQSLILLCR